jgi:LysM repeat protein
MSSIRPLITITILVVAGVILFKQINDSPPRLTPEAGNPLESASPIDVPPLASAPTDPTTLAQATSPTWDGGATTESAASPQWANDTAETVSSTSPVAPASLPAVAEQASDLPPIPALPPLATTVEAVAEAPAPPVTQSAAPPIQLPADIPMAKYPGEAPAANQAAMSQSTPETPMTPPAPATPEMSPVSPIAVTSPPEAQSAAPPITPLAAADDRYGPIPAEPATTSQVASPSPASASPSPFATSWPIIQGALERQELVEGYDMLSQWYDNPNLSPAEAEQVETLLSQLAGTVVYSTEHRLEPPYTVQAGDTLQTIAQQYQVPWQLLAKINGIPATNMVQPGQQLKVIHGPFAAVVELQKSQLTLMLSGRYAGRFPISAEPTATQSEGEWVLEQKLVNPTTAATGVVNTSYDATASVDRVLVLRSESPTAGGATISITGGPVSPAGPTAIAPAAFHLSATDAEEVADILSVGSRVTIRR